MTKELARKFLFDPKASSRYGKWELLFYTISLAKLKTILFIIHENEEKIKFVKKIYVNWTKEVLLSRTKLTKLESAQKFSRVINKSSLR